MSTSGGQPGGYRPVSAGKVYLLSNGSRSTSQIGNGQIFAVPVFCPYPVPILGMGINVTVAGGAGATVQPAIYGLAADGSPGALLIAGPVLNAAAAAAVSGAVAGVIPAGWSWAAALVLAATAPAPTITVESHLNETPLGSPGLDTGVGGDNLCPVMAGQAALPANFVTAGGSVLGPVVWVET